MKKAKEWVALIFSVISLCTQLSCGSNRSVPTDETIRAINLKRGDIVVCGPPGKEFGTVEFETTCPESVKEDFNLAIALLHSFEYDEAEKVFAKIIDKEPGCAMAYWGVAMSNNHPLWSPPTISELIKGAKAIAAAQSITKTSVKETAYINALALFYKDWDKADHHTRSLLFEKAMEKIHSRYSTDKEAAVFYALSLVAAADPADKSYTNQKKAGNILNALYPGEPTHPGIVHYIIHTYDYPELANLALPAARKYASIAPSSAHAQHMPSHIFTRLGLWDECIRSNLVATSSAKCYAENAGIIGHWDEELHGMDYLVYAYLQQGNNTLAKEQYDYLKTIRDVYPMNFKVAYAFAAIPARFTLENKNWTDAAGLKIDPDSLPWQKFPWQKAIFYFARVLGSVHTGRLDDAEAALKSLSVIRDTLLNQKDLYKANQVQIQLKASEAWILFKQGKKQDALDAMAAAADQEDKTEKSPVTPCEVLPARELQGDLFLEMNEPARALVAYEADLEKHPNRFNGLYGAALAAERGGDPEKANLYYKKLVEITGSSDTGRPEIEAARSFLKKKNISF